MDAVHVTHPEVALLRTPTGLSSNAVSELATSLNATLADVYALYLKTKNFHWHASGPRFREIHLMLDDHASQILEMADAIAERVRKIGGGTIRSVGHIARLQRISDNDADFVNAEDMLAELREDNVALASYLRIAHVTCEDHNDIPTASLIENWIEEAEGRVWFLFEATQ